LKRIQSLSAQSLPSGVTFLTQRRNGKGQLVQVYALPGRVNAATIPVGGLAGTSRGAAHPATELMVSATAGYTVLPQDLFTSLGPPLYRHTWTQVQGHRAVVTQQVNGYGIVRIDWVDPAAGVYYSVMNPRYQTSDGTSGLSADRLVSIAGGVAAR
jgi:hypothetical protein